jgi:hypothetical protein
MFSANQTLSLPSTSYSLVTSRGDGTNAYLEVFSSFAASSGWSSDATLSSTKLRIATPNAALNSGQVINFDISPYDSVEGNNAIACCVATVFGQANPTVGLPVFRLSRSGGLPIFTGGEFSTTAAYSPNPVTNISVNGAAFNPSGTVLAYSPTRTSPYIKACAWSNSSGFGTFYSDPVTPFSADYTSGSSTSYFRTSFVKFHPSGQAIFVFSTTWPYVNAWQWSDVTGFGSKYATPSIPNLGLSGLPGSPPSLTGVAFDVSTNYVAIGQRYYTPATSPNLRLYVLPFNLVTGFAAPLPQKAMPSPVNPLYPSKTSDVIHLAIHPTEQYIAVGLDTFTQGTGPIPPIPPLPAVPVRYPAIYAYQLSGAGLGDYSSTLYYNGTPQSTGAQSFLPPLACQWTPDGRALANICNDYFLSDSYFNKSNTIRYLGPLFFPFALNAPTTGINELTSPYTNGVLCPWYPGAAQIDANYTYCNGETNSMYTSAFSLNRSKKYYTPNELRTTAALTSIQAMRYITA